MTQLLNNFNTAPVDEVFFSYQGEGIFAGMPQIFVRFSGCNLKCNYCDTKTSLKINNKTKYYSEQSLYYLIEDTYKQNKRSFYSKKPSVSFTGGEPLLYADFMIGLFKKLKAKGFEIYLETNGTLDGQLSKVLDLCGIVSMDIKFKSACGKDLLRQHKNFLKQAEKKSFVKTVITNSTTADEFKKAVKLVSDISQDIKFVIQPSDNGKNVNKKVFEFYALASLKLKDVRVLPQLHKIWKIR
ncbi:MAG: 7-carboxy-7-deazaguanine synthase QueE [Endomicrobiaceae bacterium]